MKIVFLTILVTSLAGCVSFENIPTSTPIHDDFITLVENDVNLGKQTIYKNEKLKHYKVDGVDAYCSDIFSMDFELYRCFSIEGNVLVKGLNPKTSKWELLQRTVNVTKTPL